MSDERRRQENQATFRRLKWEIDSRYPSGHFVSIDRGGILADAPDFPGIMGAIRETGNDPEQVLIVQAGREYPERVVVFLRPEPLRDRQTLLGLCE